MSLKLTARNPSIARLIDEGFDVEIVHQHLLVHSIPYLNQAGVLKLGTLVCSYSELGDQDTRPQDHTMWFKGETPYRANGQQMIHVVNHSNGIVLFDQFRVDFYLSNKPNGQCPVSFYEKVTHYHNLFASEARVVDPNADGRTGKVHGQRDETSVFKYPDTASARAGITALSQKLRGSKVAIVGVGGTGSFILDLLSKTPVSEIHLFDGDDFEPHNAFRAPGASSLDDLQRKPKKVDYFANLYEPLREGIFSHPYFLDDSNIQELDSFNFVFVSVDNGDARRIITNHLVQMKIPFIDVGMGIEVVEMEENVSSLLGTCRVTLATAEKQEHLSQRLDFNEDEGDVIYRSNIQVADLNALNAAMAVIKWKQLMGFYLDQEQPHNLIYTLSLQSLSRGDSGGLVQ
ncbi:ThiF family adenylyltransferase [Hydrogenovibrio sp. SC-1]|uniref:ThiF family adenylyltransferase n=1 Tax=Hydrogenovibrio sp. SC-1 TaxID=2065820 RepID=UPI001E53C080|nr:ThiF family adenylyltransferase [Hydrogenovibrio sp. SC-1]